jgi:adenylylsulfate kinase
VEEGFTIWFTGLSGAGKSTIANVLVERLKSGGHYVELLDGDEIRTNLSSGLGFSKADRDANIRRIAFVAKLLSRNGVIAITAAISPYREIRDEARREITNNGQNPNRFVEIYVATPLEVCEQRDVKGLYAKARSGEIKQFTGISDPYEAPENAEVVVTTVGETPEQDAELIINKLVELNLLPAELSTAGNNGSSYSDDEEALVSERLKSLGYL